MDRTTPKLHIFLWSHFSKVNKKMIKIDFYGKYQKRLFFYHFLDFYPLSSSFVKIFFYNLVDYAFPDRTAKIFFQETSTPMKKSQRELGSALKKTWRRFRPIAQLYSAREIRIFMYQSNTTKTDH